MAIKESIRRRIAYVAPLLFLLAFVQPVAQALARWDWRLDLVSHFQSPALVVTLLAIVAMLLTRRRSVLLLLLLAAFQAEPLVRYSLSNPVKPLNPTGGRLRLLMANVLVDNDGFEALSAMISDTNPDIVGLVEISDAWVVGLSEISKQYPYKLSAPDGPRGLALWFKKRPISIDTAKTPTLEGWPFLHASFEFEGETRQLWLVHPASPMRRLGRFTGFPELDAIADLVAEKAGSTIVMGDFNTTEGSPYFRDFVKTTGLRDSRLGFGRQPSWPVGSPYQITLDHAFVSEDWAVVERKQGTSIGSDHLPFWFEIAPSNKARVTSNARVSASAR
jgi:endonuclease/exonuclease/phosphatase (EEP) superfamily protein YafD